MKITPLLSGQAGSPSTNVHGAAEGSNRLDRAKSIASGNSQITVSQSDTPQAPKPDVRRITMKTDATPGSSYVATEEPKSAIPDTGTVPLVIEDTKPLDPQFAALAKQRRALQAKERELVDREKALVSKPSADGVQDLVARLKSQPLSVLQEHGVTYDQLTEAILANQSGITPEIQSLKAEIKALKEGVDKTLSEKDALAEQQVLAEIQRDIDNKAFQGDEFEMIRATQSQLEVKELIHRTFKETGEILDVEEAMQLVEEDLINESLKLANTNKLKQRLAPPPTPQPQQQPQQKQIKTLTNRDTAKPVMDRKARALAAALGTLKR